MTAMGRPTMPFLERAHGSQYFAGLVEVPSAMGAIRLHHREREPDVLID